MYDNLTKEHRFIPVGMFPVAGKRFTGYPINVTRVNDDGSVMGTYDTSNMNLVQRINAMLN